MVIIIFEKDFNLPSTLPVTEALEILGAELDYISVDSPFG